MFTCYVALLSFLWMVAEALPGSNSTEFADQRFTKGDGGVHKTFLYIGIVAACFIVLGLGYFVFCKVKWREQILTCVGARNKKCQPSGGVELQPQPQLPLYQPRDFSKMRNPYVYQPRVPEVAYTNQGLNTAKELRRKPVLEQADTHWLRAEAPLIGPPPRTKRSYRSPQQNSREDIELGRHSQPRQRDQYAGQAGRAPAQSRY